MPPWRFFRPYLGIFASIDAHCAAFAAEMRRNSDGCSLGRMSESRAAGGEFRVGFSAAGVGQCLQESAEGEEDLSGIAAVGVGKFLRLIQKRRKG